MTTYNRDCNMSGHDNMQSRHVMRATNTKVSKYIHNTEKKITLKKFGKFYNKTPTT